PIIDLFFGSVGLILVFVVFYFVNIPCRNIGIKVVSEILPLFITIILAYLGFQVGFRRRVELTALMSVNRKENEEEVITKRNDTVLPETTNKGTRPKILDTSVIIAGRIADICQTNFLEGTIIIPQCILGELQHIADSSDALKRNRGRRGLDILNKTQKELPINVEIYNGDFEDVPEVDSKLVRLAQLINGIVVT